MLKKTTWLNPTQLNALNLAQLGTKLDTKTGDMSAAAIEIN